VARTVLLIALENVQSPLCDAYTSIGRLVILEHHARPIHILGRVRRGKRAHSATATLNFPFPFPFPLSLSSCPNIWPDDAGEQPAQ
jgi:hypothetical protein